MDDEAAVEMLRARLPESSPDIEENLAMNEELLIHLVMGDLARFYVRSAAGEPELRRRFWMAVDWLATRGDDRVHNAVGVSLIEWFAWGDDRSRAFVLDAKPLMSSAVHAITDDFLRSGGSTSRVVRSGAITEPKDDRVHEIACGQRECLGDREPFLT